MTHRVLTVRFVQSIAILALTTLGVGCSRHVEKRSLTPVARHELDRDVDDPDRERTDPGGRPLPGTDHPGEAIRFRNLSLEDEHGGIPIDGPVRAKAHLKQMQLAGAAQQLEQLESIAGISRSGWTSVGPGNVGGRIRTIAIHPTTPATMFAGSVGGGIWKTTTGGAAWAPVDDFLASLAVSSIVINPAVPNVMYAGTGEGFYSTDGLMGAGIFKSSDGGTTWSQLTATNNSSFLYVNRLALSPNGATLLAATRTGMFRSRDAGATFTGASGINKEVADVAFNPSDSTRAVASGFKGNAWYSTNGGGTWTAATGLPGGTSGRVEVAYAPSAPAIVYASVDVNKGSIYVSVNGGVSYTFVSHPAQQYLGAQGWYGNALWVNPIDPHAIIVGGIDLYRSTNGGATISRISDWHNAPLSDHADHHVLVSPPGFDNLTNKTVFSGDDGGIYQMADWSTVGGGGAADCTAVSPFDCTAGWTSLNNNLGVTQFYGGAGHAATGRIVGGTQDNGTLVYTGNAQGWTTEFGGDGGYAAIDPTNANNLYGEYINLALHRSLTGSGNGADYINGLFWTGSNYVCKPAPFFIPDVCANGNIVGHANFIAPFTLDPNAPARLLAGGWSLWRTNDATAPNTATGGPVWASIKVPNATNSPISAIAVAKGNSDLIWVGHNNGDVFVTNAGTSPSPAWIPVDNGTTPLPNRFVTRLTIDPRDPNIVYATFGGFTADNVYRTTDGGGTWTNIAGSGSTALPAAPVRDLKILPANSNWLYAATEIGLFASGDRGATWGPPTMSPTDGPANVAVDELFFLDASTLVAVTHGRGMFKATVAAGRGSITGTVTNAATGAVVSGAGIDVYADSGAVVAHATANGAGVYTVGLATGSYFAVASGAGLEAQLYSGMTCPRICNVATGTPISVTPGTTTTNINFALAQMVAPATLINPADHATNVDLTQPFTWTIVPGAQAYYLYVGTSVGARDLVNTGEIQQTSYRPPLTLPANQTLYARLWTKVSGTWRYVDTTFSAAPTIAYFTYPASGTPTVNPTLPLTWTAVPAAQAYYLYVGSTLGGKDLVNPGEIHQTSYLIHTTLPANQTLYARLWTKVGGHWRYVDATFTEPTLIARFTYPASGATTIDPAQSLTWTTVPNAQAYFLYIGSTPGGKDLVNTGELHQTSYLIRTALIRTALPANQTLYARLWTKVGGVWRYTDTTFSVS